MRAGQRLDGDVLAGQGDPARHEEVVGEELEAEVVEPCQVALLAGDAGPAEGPAAFAEQRPDVFGDEARDRHRLVDRHAGVAALLADAGAVLEGRHAGGEEAVHGAQLAHHRGARLTQVLLAVGVAQRVGLLRGAAGRDVRDGVVARAHLGDDVGPEALSQASSKRSAALPTTAMPERLALGGRLLRQRDGLVERADLDVDELLLDATVDDALVRVHHDADAAVHRHGARLVAAHAAGAGGRAGYARRASRRSTCGRWPRRSRRCPGSRPACRCTPTARPCTARTS